MRLLTIILAMFLSCTAYAAAPTPPLPELLANHAKAMGTIDKVQSRRLRMRVVGMAPFDIPVVVESKRPNLIRKEVALQGSVQVQAFDGSDAWKSDPFVPGGAAPAAMPAEEAKLIVEEADFDGALVNSTAKGIRVSYAGAAEVAGKPAHKLQVNLANGNESTVYLDAATLLEVKRVQTRPMMGKMVEAEIVPSDWRLVDGVRIPHRIEIGLPGAKQPVAVIIDAVELNVPMVATRFTRPY
jgi:hypothetical protein